MPKQKVDKKDIIKASLKVFKNLGYHRASMADIGKECGLLKGSIYHYFSSKEALMHEVIHYLHDYYKREVFSIALDDLLSGEEKLNKLTEFSERIFLEEKGGCLMANIGLETVNVVPEFSIRIRNFFNDWIEALANIFEEKYSQEEAHKLAQQAVAEIEGAVLLMQLFDSRSFLDQAHASIKNKFLVVERR